MSEARRYEGPADGPLIHEANRNLVVVSRLQSDAD